MVFLKIEKEYTFEELIKEYCDKYSCIKYYKKKNGGLSSARNYGLKYVTGDYIIFLDSDDYFTDNTVLERLASLITNEDLIFLNYTRDKFGDVFIVQEEHEDISLKIENLAKSRTNDKYRFIKFFKSCPSLNKFSIISIMFAESCF